MSAIDKSLLNQGVCPRELSGHLLSLSGFTRGDDHQKGLFSAGSRHELETARSVRDVLLVVKSAHASFLDYELFHEISMHFGADKGQEDAFQYPENLRHYADTCSVEAFANSSPDALLLGKSSSNGEFLSLTFEVNMQPSSKLAELRSLQRTIAEELGLSSCALRLLRIEVQPEGFVTATLQIPAPLGHVLFCWRETGYSFAAEQARVSRGLCPVAEVQWLRVGL